MKPFFDWPISYDAASYYSIVAKNYLGTNIFDILLHSWNALQAPFYFSFISLFCTIFGFSYANAVLAQSILCLIFVAYTLKKVIALKAAENAPFNRIIFVLFFSILWLSSGVLYAEGSVFELRLDLYSSILLSLSLISLLDQSRYSFLWIAFAFSERFHNVSSFAAAAGAFTLLDLIARRDFKYSLTIVKKCLMAGSLYVILRFNQFIVLTKAYLGHVDGEQVTLRGDAPNMLSLSFLKFYPKGLWTEYLLYPWGRIAFFLGLVSVIVGLIQYRQQLLHSSKRLLFFLTFSSLVIGILLTINPIRNNLSVLRYALVPFLLASSLFISHLAANTFFARKTKLIIASLCLFIGLSAFGEYKRLLRLWNETDYNGYREHSFAKQIDEQLMFVHQDALNRKLTQISIYPLFYYDFNLSDNIWDIFYARNKIPALKVQSSLPMSYQNPIQDVKTALTKAHYVVIGENCLDPRVIKVNQQIKDIFPEIQKLIKESCHRSPVAHFKTAVCEFDVLKCNN